ncbi:zinc finger, CCHC-type, retrotransposon gag domain protein [Tanacetum coccineum]
MSKQLPTILAQSQENFRKSEEARKAVEKSGKKKRANEDAKRRRKAMKDKRVAEEQERKRKAEQDMKNAEDAERRRYEEAKRQRSAEAQRMDVAIKNYCHQGLMDKLEEKFLKLQHNDMTVPKYISKFNEKTRFAKYQVATEERKIKRYIWGLRSEIRGPVQQARPATFQEAVELALMVEKENIRQLEEGGDNKRKRENRDDDVKKIKTNSGKMKNVGEYKPCTICKKTNKRECWHDNCQNCEKSGHTSKEYKDEWVCFKCKSPGHKIVDCLERKPHDTQPRKTMGKELTAKNA